MDTGIYTLKWFFQCFLDRIPFNLTIRVWDVYLLEGESIMIAMAYTILKLHRKSLLKMEMDELMEFLQKTLESDFGYEDDFVIETALKDSLAELRSSRLHTAGPTPDSEKPQKPFGLLDNIPDEEEETLVGQRLPVKDEERQFHRSTLQREEENIRKLQHIDSQTSMDDGSIDRSLNETGSLEDPQSDLLEGDISLDTTNSAHTPTPTSEKEWNRQSFSPLPSSKDQDELDDSLMFMMKQASIKETPDKSQSVRARQRFPEIDELEFRGAKMLQEELKKGEKRRLKEMKRPVSADPGHQRKKEDREEDKRMSAYANIPDFGEGVMECSQSRSSIDRGSSKSKSRSSSRIRLSSKDTSRSIGSSSMLDTTGSSKVLNISSDSVRDDSQHSQPSSRQSHRQSSKDLRERIRADMHAQNLERGQAHHRSKPPDSLPPQTVLKPINKSSYYFGEAPDLDEILTSVNGKDGSLVGDDVSTPMNEPMPSDILHQGDCYLMQNRTSTHMQEAPALTPHASEVVCIKVPFSDPYEPLGPLLTTQHNIERLTAQQISPHYNGHKVTIQVNREDQEENRLFQGESPFGPINTSHLNFTTREVGRQQVTKRHITTKEKKISSAGSSLHTSTHSMYVSEHSERTAPVGRPPLATSEDLKDNPESKHYSRQASTHSGHVSRHNSGRQSSTEDQTDRTINGSRSGGRNRSRNHHSTTAGHNHSLHNESYASNDGDVWENRTRSNSRNDTKDNKMANLRKETFF
eukprot:GFUD01004986.1.p1 GENE.GFUD01004986.1~~GFUD01004986.1.p1  ORF type:complete len:865 (-),score=218.95 GFUD01004986.1:642-2888(-)